MKTRTATSATLAVLLLALPPVGGAEPSYSDPQPRIESEVVAIPPEDPADPTVWDVLFTWQGDPDATYFLQASFDLEEWFYLPDVMAGVDDEMESGFENVTGENGSPAAFLRAIAVEAEPGAPEDGDADRDRLTNGLELTTYETDPLVDDTDDDGLLDGDEVLSYLSDPLDSDSDGDGLGDGDEILVHFSNPNATDSDGDGINDGVEVNTHGSDPAHTDTDGDGISDDDEITQGTSITNPDTDGDGLPDGIDPNPTTPDFTTSAATVLKVWAPLE